MTDRTHREHSIASCVSVSAETIEWLLQTRDPVALGVEAAEVVLHECDADASAILLVAADQQLAVTGRALRDRLDTLGPTARLLGLLGDEAVQLAAPVQLERDGAGNTLLRRALRDEGFWLAIAVPLRLTDAAQSLGAIVLFWRSPSAIVQSSQALAVSMAHYLTLALTNARRFYASEQERIQSVELIDQVGEALLIADADTLLIERINQAAEEISGYSARMLIGRSLETVISYSPNQRQTLRGVRGRVRLEGELVRRNGSQLPVALLAAEVQGERRLLALSLHDLHEQSRPLQQLMLAERMAGMHHMTAVIAHEVNNPLQALANVLQLLGKPLEPEKHTRYLSMAQIEIERLIRLVRRALDVHQPTPGSRRPIAIHTLLAEVIEQVNTQAQRQSVTITSEMATGGQWVVGVASHLREVFLSMGLNALEAMPEGGQLHIRAQLDTQCTDSQDQMLVIEWTDTGPGIPEERLQEIFEPFYTTKHGSAGLGLAICYSIIEHHAGRLTVSTSAQGTTFRVSLPALSASEAT